MVNGAVTNYGEFLFKGELPTVSLEKKTVNRRTFILRGVTSLSCGSVSVSTHVNVRLYLEDSAFPPRADGCRLPLGFPFFCHC